MTDLNLTPSDWGSGCVSWRCDSTTVNGTSVLRGLYVKVMFPGLSGRKERNRIVLRLDKSEEQDSQGHYFPE